MLYALLAVVVGLILLVWSSDKFVDGAIGIAESVGLSKAMIGLTIVAIGTSAPEIIVSLVSAFTGAPELALGNAVGSNIANIGLVLGITALIAALPVKRGLLKEDLPALLAVTLVCGILISDGELSMTDALAMLAMLIFLMFLLIRYKKEHAADFIDPETEAAVPDVPAGRSLLLFVFGLLILIGSSRLLVWGAVEIAGAMGVSEMVIGLTIVAIGTSLPELAASVASALRKQHDIALGNIIGSNILNLLAVLSAAALIQPIQVERMALLRDYGAMTAITLLLALFIVWPKRERQLSTAEGIVLLTAYLGYMFWLYQQTPIA